MRALKLVPLPVVFLLCCSVCRGQDLTTLNGNWHLAGQFGHRANDTRLFVSLAVDGNKVFGSGDVVTSCDGGGPFSIRGQIASDGTFVLYADSGDPKIGRKISIHGKLPAPGSTQWSGNYEVSRISDSCPAIASGDFVATQLPDVKGVYSGTLFTADRTPVTVTVEIKQEELAIFEDEPGHVFGMIPLDATMKLEGTTLRETLTADATPALLSSRMQGDNCLLVFPVGSQFSVVLEGEITDPSANQLRAVFTYPSKDFAAAGLLTRR